MSPSEFHLRAALHEGEGEAPDADAIIGAALRLKRQRHDRVVRGGIAAAVLVLAGIGGGIALANHTSGKGASEAQSPALGRASSSRVEAPEKADLPAGAARLGKGTAGGAAAGSGVSGASNGQAGSAPVVGPIPLPAGSQATAGCPSSPVRYTLPASDANTRRAATASLFRAPVTRLVICDYGAAGNPTSRELTGSAAAKVADAIEGSTASQSHRACLALAPATLLAFGATGEQTPLEVSGTCNQLVVTNGIAVRYVAPSTLYPGS